MGLRVSILVLLGLFLRALPADAGVLTVCNEGNVTINTVIVESKLLGWRVSGWYPVPAHKCEEVFHTSFANLLLGFAYLDANHVMREHASVPSKPDYDIYDVEETFCVKPDQFEYESQERPVTTCGVGFAPLTFRVFVRLTNVAVAEYTTKPRSDENGRPLGQPADVLAPARTALLLGRRVSLGADGLRWQFDDGSLAFENLSQHVPDAFFDIPTKPAGSVSVAPADIDRTSTLMTDIVRLLKTTNVRYDTGFLGDWGEHGRLCFEDTGMIRCANHNALDYDNTGVNDHSVSFKCRADSLCAFMAAPWNESRRLGKVRLKDQDRQLTAQAGLFVNGLPSQEAAETLAARIRELAGLVAKYRDTVR